MACLLFAIPLALLAALAYPPLRRATARIAPASRARLLLALSGVPFVGACAGLLASFVPSLLSWADGVADHCHLHTDHPHLCLLHPPQLAHSGFALTVLSGAAVLAIVIGGSWLLRCLQTRQRLAQLLRMSERDPVRGVHVVPTEAPLAFAAGLRTPQVFLSRHMFEQLSSAQIDVIVAHERAHAVRLDALTFMIASVLSRLHLPATRRIMLADLALAAEQACDEAACAATGDRLLVAEAIVAVEKLFAKRERSADLPLFGTSHFTDSNVAERVLAMLDARRDGARLPRSAWAAGALALMLLAAFGGQLHHTTESILGLIFH
ncbi:M56 family metallopeptidase [Massilia frigida]|uniref:M56 family metallopeptidase n=1 Tax=Massilia frigida TaxID=2609281 RepID=UPI001423CD81